MTARLAIVHDDPAAADHLAIRLRRHGYVLDFYTQDTLPDALGQRPAPDVVLLALALSETGGLEMIRTIRQVYPAAPVILLSDRQAPEAVAEAVRLGAADYVVKPEDPAGAGDAALDAAIQRALERESLSAELARLGAQMPEDPEGTQPCWGTGPAMQRLMAMVDRVADSDAGVLLRGERGVGKEVIARELHRRSGRRTRGFVKVNCAGLPADALERELLGSHLEVGRLEAAQHGTLMLDEIGGLPLPLQSVLLDALQSRAATRPGSGQHVDVDVRVIAATHRDLEVLMRQGRFREDLFYRLQVIELLVPPLRTRRDEIPALVEFFIAKYSKIYRRAAVRPSQLLLDALVAYPWPGNIRELENAMKRFVVLQDESLVLTEFLRPRPSGVPGSPGGQHRLIAAPRVLDVAHVRPRVNQAQQSLEQPDDDNPGNEASAIDTGPGVDLHLVARAAAMQAERQAIGDALARFQWNRRKAAQYLNVSYKTLLNKMKECGISERH